MRQLVFISVCSLFLAACQSGSSQRSSLPDQPQLDVPAGAQSVNIAADPMTEIQRPFRIVSVNEAWEGLCGYSSQESQGESLGKLLQGPETDQMTITSLLNQLMRGEEASAVLTNYTKNGRKFRNRLQVGPLYSDNGKISHFVGVLKEVAM